VIDTSFPVTVPVSAVKLTGEGNAVVVSLEINGRWIEVIKDFSSLRSHIVEAAGILECVAGEPAW